MRRLSGLHIPSDIPAVGFEGYKSNNTAYVAGTLQTLSFNTIVTDEAGFWAAGSPAQITVPVGFGGWYVLNVAYSFDSGVAVPQYNQALISVNGVYIAVNYSTRTNAGVVNLCVSVPYLLVSGDVVVFTFNSNVAGTLLAAAKYGQYARVVRMGMGGMS